MIPIYSEKLSEGLERERSGGVLSSAHLEVDRFSCVFCRSSHGEEVSFSIDTPPCQVLGWHSGFEILKPRLTRPNTKPEHCQIEGLIEAISIFLGHEKNSSWEVNRKMCKNFMLWFLDKMLPSLKMLRWLSVLTICFLRMVQRLHEFNFKRPTSVKAFYPRGFADCKVIWATLWFVFTLGSKLWIWQGFSSKKLFFLLLYSV